MTGTPRHVVVVGGGVIGLSTAYFLRKAGAMVTLLERSTVGSGASWGNSGWIAPTFAEPLAGPGMVGSALRALARPNGSFYLSPRHLPRLVPWLWRFWRSSSAQRHLAGVRALGELAVHTDRIYDQLAADGVRFEMHSDGVTHAFLDRANALRALNGLLSFREFGYELPDDVLSGRELRQQEPALGDSVAAGFVVPGERIVYPPSLLSGLKKRTAELGVTLEQHQSVRSFGTDGQVVRGVHVDSGVIEADAVVLAAGVWTRELGAQLGVRIPLEAGKGYSFKLTPRVMPRRSLHLLEARVAASPFNDGLLVAGTMELSGNDERVNESRLEAVARSARRYLSSWDRRPIRERWMGMRPLTPDGLPVIGRAGDWRNLYLATGHGMMGMMLGPMTGSTLAGVVLDEMDPRALAPFDPNRFSRHRGPDRSAVTADRPFSGARASA